LSFKASFSGLFAAVVSCASFRYLSKTTVARRFLGVPRFVKNGAFSACSSSASCHSEAPTHFIMLRMVAFLERAWPASSMLIHIEAAQDAGLLAVHMEPGRSATTVTAGTPPRSGRSVLRILEWTSVGIS
jgi:hypothetical protein